MFKYKENYGEHHFPIQNITNSPKRTIYRGLRKYNAFEVQIGYKIKTNLTEISQLSVFATFKYFP